MNNSLLIDLVDEAIMNDSVDMFKNLKLTSEQLVAFVYQVTGPKTGTLSSRGS